MIFTLVLIVYYNYLDLLQQYNMLKMAKKKPSLDIFNLAFLLQKMSYKYFSNKNITLTEHENRDPPYMFNT